MASDSVLIDRGQDAPSLHTERLDTQPPPLGKRRVDLAEASTLNEDSMEPDAPPTEVSLPSALRAQKASRRMAAPKNLQSRPSMPTDSFPWHGVRTLCMEFRSQHGDALLLFGISTLPFDERQVERVGQLLKQGYREHFAHAEGRQLALLVPETNSDRFEELRLEVLAALTDPHRGADFIAIGHAPLSLTDDIVERGHRAEQQARSEFEKGVRRV